MEQGKFPSEVIDLPSKGFFYNQDNPISTGRVEIKYMTAKEEDILTSRNLIQKGIVIDKLLESLIVTPIDYTELLIGDKNAIVYASRVLAYGKDYKVEIECPTCNKKSENNIDLSLLEHKTIDFNKFNKGSDETEFILPQSKIKTTLKLLRSKDEKVIDETLKGMKKITAQTGTSFEMTTRLKHIITSINGVRDREKINKFVSEELLARDSLEIRSFMKSITPDLDTTFYFTCTDCGFEKELDIPLNVEFFWPRGSR